jgi:hypothetical protein
MSSLKERRPAGTVLLPDHAGFGPWHTTDLDPMMG